MFLFSGQSPNRVKPGGEISSPLHSPVNPQEVCWAFKKRRRSISLGWRESFPRGHLSMLFGILCSRKKRFADRRNALRDFCLSEDLYRFKSGSMAKTRAGDPVPSLINIGMTYRIAPEAGSRSRLAMFSQASLSDANRT